MKTNNLQFQAGILAAALIFASCRTGGEPTPEPPTGSDPAITLACNYFSENPNAILVDNPDAPVDYIVTCNGMSIPDDVVIEPGVTIAFETDASFWIREDGSLKAVGTADKPITFTGVDKSRGAWGGIFFESNDPKNEMKYTVVEYAGGAAPSWGSSQKGGVVVGANASLKLEYSTIQHCDVFGYNLFYNATVANTTISNNTFKNNEVPMQIAYPVVGLVAGSNQFLENTTNKVQVYNSYQVGNAQILRRLNVPYSFLNGVSKTFTIGKEGKLTIEPGTIMEMGTDVNLYNYGSLIMKGTSANKIIVRGNVATPGGWGCITFDDTNSPENSIEYVEILHAGNKATATSTHYSEKGAIVTIYDPTVTIDNVDFKDIKSCIISPSHHGTSNLTVGTSITKTNVNTAGISECAY